MRPLPRLLMRNQHGLVTHGQLVTAGFSRDDVKRLLRQEVLVRVRHGVYADGDTYRALDHHRGRPILGLHAAAMTLRATDYVFSHDSAAILHGMGVPDPLGALVHVTRQKVHGDAVRSGVKHHRAPFRPADVTEVDGLRVLGPARTALDMAREHGRAAGLAACDGALRRGVSRDELGECLRRMWCWPHSQVMRWCVGMADPGAESYLESLGRDLVLELGIGRPQTQFGLSDGRTVWCDLRVGRHVFEIDGRLKYRTGNFAGLEPETVLWQEKQRQDFITGFKLGVSRITVHDCGSGRSAAVQRLEREYLDTCARFGTSVADLEPFIVRQHRRPSAS